MKTAKKRDDSIPLASYLWPTMQSSVLYSWISLVVVALIIYTTLVGWMKIRALEAHLRIANATISEAIEAGDWEFALNALKANSTLGEFFNLGLLSVDGKSVFAGPLGTEPFGIGSFCSKNVAGGNIQLRGCTRVLAVADLFAIGLFLIVSVLFSVYSFALIKNRILQQFSNVTRFLTGESGSERSHIREIEIVRAEIADLVTQRELSSKQVALAELATQVAHDIRSPLSALKIVTKYIDDVDGEKRALIENAADRIESIANKLLEEYRNKAKQEIGPFNLLPLVESIFEEKRNLFHDKENILLIKECINYSSYIFNKVDPIDFCSIVSNLINNAVESLPLDRGRVLVTLTTIGAFSIVQISDNGKGMSEEILKNVGTSRGVTFGKTNGSGIGLYHAMNTVKEWGGELTIESVFEVGTTVEIKLPIFLTPQAFAGA